MSEQNKGSNTDHITAAQVFERLKRMHASQEVQQIPAESKVGRPDGSADKRTDKIKLRRPSRREPPGVKSMRKVRDRVHKMVERILAAPEDQRERLSVQIGAAFLRAAETGNPIEIGAFIKDGFPVDYQDPQTGETALHIVAACKARKALRVLLKSGECNYLLRDNQGRLASEMAYLYGRDPAVARFLGIKERKQAEWLPTSPSNSVNMGPSIIVSTLTGSFAFVSFACNQLANIRDLPPNFLAFLPAPYILA